MAAGGHAVVVQLAGDGTGDLRLQANVLNVYVNRALAAGPGPVTVIGYSAGAVVAPLVVGIVLRTLRTAALTAPRPSECHSLQALGSYGS